jgi:uncharacterized protein
MKIHYISIINCTIKISVMEGVVEKNINKTSDKQLAEELEKAKNAMKDVLTKAPPTIGLIGVSGTGKSSTINSLFGTKLAVSDVVACTKEFSNNNVSATIKNGEITGYKTHLCVVDAPGLGEDVSRDPEYLDMYNQYLPQCDVILWVLTARNRAIALDQLYLSKLSAFSERIIFGINQVDLVEPMDWENTNLPSEKQSLNIDVIVADRKEKIENVLKRDIKIIPYSARKFYNLPKLFSCIVESCPSDRAWIFGMLKGFSAYDFIEDPQLRERIKTLVEHGTCSDSDKENGNRLRKKMGK